MKKLNPNDLSLNPKTVSEISKSNAPNTKELDTIRETACDSETNITCLETEGEKCPTETFASACACPSKNCTVNCESLGCTNSQGAVCCELSKNNDCEQLYSKNNENTCFCVATNGCVESVAEPCVTIMTNQGWTCDAELTNGMKSCDNCEAIRTVGC